MSWSVSTKKKVRNVFGQLQAGQYYCYVNHHPVTKDPIYVGMGHGSRYLPSEHKENVRWIQLLEKYTSKDIETYIFPCNSSKEALQWESELIYMFRSQGFDLYNMTDGGEYAQHCQEIVEKCRQAAITAHKQRPLEKQQDRSSKLSRSLKAYYATLSEDEREELNRRNRESYYALPVSKRQQMIVKHLITQSSKDAVVLEEENSRRKATLRLTYSQHSAEKKKEISLHRSEGLARRGPEAERLRIERGLATRRRNKELKLQQQKDQPQ